MNTLFLIILATLIGGILSALIASVVLLFDDATRHRLIPHFVSFATGTLLGAAFLALLPHAIEGAGPDQVHLIGGTVLAGLLTFFVLEKLVIWRHCHHDDCEAHSHDIATGRGDASAAVMMVGDGIHNLIDGTLIAAAFLVDPHLGWMTTVAVVAHEVPQEVGEFAVLLKAGYTRRKAFILNLLVGLTTAVGGVLAWAFLDNARGLLPFALAFAAASFIYVAVADLIPGMHQRTRVADSLSQALLIAAGVAVIVGTHALVY
jgi:zinc and cadmium transporter